MESFKLYKQAKSHQAQYQFQQALNMLNELVEKHPESLYAEQAESEIEEIKEQMSKGPVSSSACIYSRRLSIFSLTIFVGGVFKFYMSSMDYESIGPYVLGSLINAMLAVGFGLFGKMKVTKYPDHLLGLGAAVLGLRLGGILVIVNILMIVQLNRVM